VEGKVFIVVCANVTNERLITPRKKSLALEATGRDSLGRESSLLDVVAVVAAVSRKHAAFDIPTLFIAARIVHTRNFPRLPTRFSPAFGGWEKEMCESLTAFVVHRLNVRWFCLVAEWRDGSLASDVTMKAYKSS